MKLTEYEFDHLKEFITGDNSLTPYMNGQAIVRLFQSVGIRDVYTGAVPDGLSRNNYAFDRLGKINNSIALKNLFEIIFSQRHFADSGLNIETAVNKVNTLISPNGYRLVELDGDYKVNSADAYDDEKSAEIHFEELQQKIKDELHNAKFLIWVAMAWFTDKDLFAILDQKRKVGLSVQVLLLEDDINLKSGIEYKAGFNTIMVPKKGPYENIMHNKFCIIDLKTVIHGSYNWTVKAQYNKETLDIEHGRQTAEKFATEFIKLKNQI